MKKWKILLIVVVISLLLGSVSVNAGVNNGDNINDWTAQYKLDINKHQPNKTFSSNGVDTAKMNIVIRNKTTNNLARALSDREVLLGSENSIIKPRKVTIIKGDARSEDISLTSTQPGIAKVKAEGIGFDEVATTSVEFTPPSVPSALLLAAFPNENILADGIHPTRLTVRLLKQDGELFIPQVDRYIDMGTDRGETPPRIKISNENYFGKEDYTTYKAGTVNITAKSHDFNLEDSTLVTFISPITLLTLIFAALGGFLAGIFKYYREYKDGIFIKPKKIGDTRRLGMLVHAIIHAFFGLVVYIGACVNMPLSNVFDLPIDIWHGVFMIGITGGLFFFAIISFWGLIIKHIS